MDTETVLYIVVAILATGLIGVGGFLWRKENNSKGGSFLNNLEWRRAVKHFGKDVVDTKPIEKAIINAPSAFGLQPFKVVVVTDLETKKKLRSVSFEQAQIEECQTLYIFCAIKDIDVRVEQFIDETKNEALRPMIKGFLDNCPDKIAWAKYQTYIALGFGLAAAAEKQIYSCPMEGFLADKYVEILGLNSNMIPCVLLAVGSESKDQKLHPRFRFGEDDLLIRL
jgi:nitroreductase